MSNNECRTCGLAKRAFALFMAIVLATTLTPSFALASETDASTGTVAQQSASIEAAGNATTPAASANESEASASAGSEKQAASNNDAGGNSTTGAPQSGTSESANANNAAEPAGSNASGNASNQAASSSNSASPTLAAEAETVSATLKISVYGTVLVSHTFSIEKGKTVKDLLELASEDGYIVYSFNDDSTTYDNGQSHFVRKITIKGEKFDQDEIANSYWMSTISNDPSKYDLGIEHDVIDCDGYSYSLNLAKYPDDGSKYDNGTGGYPTTPDASHPDKASGNDATSFVKSNGNTSTVTSAPTSSNNAVLAWKKSGYGAGNKCSGILAIGDFVYIVTDDWSSNPATLRKLDAKTGKELETLSLFSSIDSMCRMTYTNGIIVIPLSSGRLQGVSATEMKTLWVSNAIATGDMNLSTVTVGTKGMLFTGTTSDWSATSGSFYGINAITGECLWTNKNSEAGYYWAGACAIGDILVYGDNAGWLKAVEAETGKIKSKIKLSSAIQSTVISNSAGTKAYVETKDGIIHEIEVGFDGSLSEQKTAKIGPYGGGTSTPTLFEGNLYVGGGVWGSKGSFSVIDAETMQVKSTVELPYYVQSAPLVAKAADGKIYAYFTCNGAEADKDGNYTSGGGAWVYCLETDKVTRLFDATGEAANYCTSSIVAGSDGTLYWTNDSGTLFALANAATVKKDEPQTPNKPDNEASKNKANNQSGTDNDANNTDSKKTGNSPDNSSNANGSVAAQTPLSTASLNPESTDSETVENASAEDQGFGVEPSSATSARNASSDDARSDQQIPWLPITGVAVGCAGLIGVGVYLFRRRSL